MMRYVFGFVAAASVAAMVFAGCGGSSSGSCEDAFSALCQRASTCSASGSVNLLTPEGDAGFTTLMFKTESDCEALYDLACDNTASIKSLDATACESAAEKAACGGSGDGKGVVLPTACDGNKN